MSQVAQNSEKIVHFTVRKDKYQGILVEKFSTENNDFFFKIHHQPIKVHCEQIQQIIRSTGVQRTKKIRVDIGPFKYEYFNRDTASFKGCPLASVDLQIDKVCNLYINKELGAMKRAATVAQTKQQKMEEKNKKIVDKMYQAELHFQEMRAKRLAEMMGPATVPGPSNTASAPHSLQNLPMARVSPHNHTQNMPFASGSDPQVNEDDPMNAPLPRDSDNFD